MLIYHRSLAISLFLGCTAATPALSHDETHGWKDETRGPKIVDARGRFVGIPGLLRQNQGAWYKLDLNISGFNSVEGALLVYPSTNCSGQAYMQVVGMPAAASFVSAPVQPSADYVTDGVVYFPGPPYTKKLMRSQRLVTATSQGVCALIEYEDRAVAGPALNERFTGFAGPFQVK